MKGKLFLAISLLTIALTSCGNGSNSNNDSPAQSDVTEDEAKFGLDHQEVTMGIGSIQIIKATKDATFEISNPEVAELTIQPQSNYVMIKGIKDGVTTLKATDKSGEIIECSINIVKNEIKLVNIENDEISIDLTSPNYEIMHNVTYTMEQNVTYESSNNKILTVGQSGTITAIRPGTATVTLTHNSGAQKTLTVNVTGVYVPPEIPLTWSVGPIASKSHVQGIAIDDDHKYLYYTFTNVLVKTDTTGNVLGTVVNFMGHVGDCKFNDEDGYLYCLLLATKTWGWDYENQGAYILQIDVSKIDRLDIDCKKADFIKACWIQDLDDLLKHDKYGVDAVDGLGIGPKFGTTTGKNYITVATNNPSANVASTLTRTDNSSTIFFQFDFDEFNKIKQPIDYDSPKSNSIYSKERYFLYTGEPLEYGPQVIEYDAYSQKWFIVTYGSAKKQFLPANAYTFVIPAANEPVEKEIAGCDGEKGLHLVLSKEGQRINDDIYCYTFWQANTGLISLGNGKFLVSNSKNSGGQCTTIDTWVYTEGKDEVGFEKIR